MDRLSKPSLCIGGVAFGGIATLILVLLISSIGGYTLARRESPAYPLRRQRLGLMYNGGLRSMTHADAAGSAGPNPLPHQLASPSLPAAPDRMLVVAGFSGANRTKEPYDLSWLFYYFGDYCITVVDHAEEDDPVKPFVVTPNTAFEAAPYLRFIVDHYHNLPARMVFLHGHERAWHDTNLVQTLRHLNWSLPYANLNANARGTLRVDDIDQATRYENVAQIWPRVVAPFVEPNAAIPLRFDIYKSAQFLVSRERVRFWPLAFWENYLNFTRYPEPTVSRASKNLRYGCEHLWTYLMSERATDLGWGTAMYHPNVEYCSILTLPHDECMRRIRAKAPPPPMPAWQREAVNGARNGFYPCGAYPQPPSTHQFHD